VISHIIAWVILPARLCVVMQDEISSANPGVQLLEQHGLSGLIPCARNVTAPAPPPPLPPVAGRGAKEPSPRTNNAVFNRRESR
jgi:hypothetical protein